MRPTAGVTEAAASLLEIDPTLSHALGARVAADIGHELIVPVLDVADGPWAPPSRDQLGDGIVAMVVLRGLLAAGDPVRLIGPGDTVEPWDDGVSWFACTQARMALIGTQFIEALKRWPRATGRVLDRASDTPPPIPSAGAIDERVLDVLWQAAGRWGIPRRDGVDVPATLDEGVLATLLGVSERRVQAAVAVLSARGAIVRNGGAGWVLPMAPPGPRAGYSRERRDDLRARQAHQMAVSRAMRSVHAALALQSEAQMAIGRRRRNPGPTVTSRSDL
ncbi:MAG TPA: hypothetical protein VFZ00_17345 [Solirubrobacter sp.]|nr:hypothetical protein [Solirubrobacter sp.]